MCLTNFAAYDRGGILPQGGAEIEVVREEAPEMGLGDYIRAETLDARVEATEEISLPSANAAIRLAYTDAFGPSLAYANVTWYVRRGDALYKFYLTARSDEPQWGAWTAAFDAMVRSAAF